LLAAGTDVTTSAILVNGSPALRKRFGPVVMRFDFEFAAGIDVAVVVVAPHHGHVFLKSLDFVVGLVDDGQTLPIDQGLTLAIIRCGGDRQAVLVKSADAVVTRAQNPVVLSINQAPALQDAHPGNALLKILGFVVNRGDFPLVFGVDVAETFFGLHHRHAALEFASGLVLEIHDHIALLLPQPGPPKNH
jgi:hypothetical protein